MVDVRQVSVSDSTYRVDSGDIVSVEPGSPDLFSNRLVVGRLDESFSRTPTGGLRLPASLTRTGVLVYRRPDGSVQREYRPAEEVFKTDSLRTLEDAPVTDLHPSTMVDGSNYRALSRGHVREARQDGKFVAATVLVQDADLVSKVEKRDRKEISCGYKCRLDMTPGISPDGERYDGVQRDIVYNHVALLPVGAGRAGREVALRLDAAYEDRTDAAPAFKPGDRVKALVNHMPGMSGKTGKVTEAREGSPPYYAVKFNGDSMPHKWLAENEISASRTDQDEPMKTIRIDGRDYVIGSDEHLAKLSEDSAKAIAAVTTRADKAEADLKTATARADKAEADLKAANERADAAEKPAKEAARKDLETKAAKVLGSDYKFDGKTDAEITADVAKAALEGKAVTKTDSNGGAREAALRPTLPTTGGESTFTVAPVALHRQPLAHNAR